MRKTSSKNSNKSIRGGQKILGLLCLCDKGQSNKENQQSTQDSKVDSTESDPHRERSCEKSEHNSGSAEATSNEVESAVNSHRLVENTGVRKVSTTQCQQKLQVMRWRVQSTHTG